MTATELGLPDDVRSWIEMAAQGRLVQAEQKPGGARREAWFVDVERDGGERDELFVRHDRSDPASTGDPWTIGREAAVYLALQGTEVPVPRVLGLHPHGKALLAERVAGDTWFSRIADPAEQLATAQDFVRHLAALHRLDAASLDVAGFPPPTSIPDLVEHELDEWDTVLAHRGGPPEPGLRLTLDWLRSHVPDHDGPVVLVQGDTGPGNFLYAEGRVTAIVDWELAHLGDPMDDIAWLCLRATQEPFTHLPDRLREYEELSGHEVDDERVRYYRVMAEAKLLVMAHRGPGARPDEDPGDLGNRLIYGMLHRRLWLAALADVLGLEVPAAERPPTTAPSGILRLYDAVLAQLREVIVPALADPLARQRAKGVARAVKHLAAVAQHGGFYADRELDDLARLLGHRPPSIEAGRAALDAALASHRCTEAQYLQQLLRRAARENELLRPASGVLADRTWPPLR